ncbi:MAG TPA: hypothetical protein VIL49_17995 [Capillimicrobium sp.]
MTEGRQRLEAIARERGGGLWLVGGAVRDAALGVPARDLDVAVEGDALAVAREAGEVLSEHERFGTAEALVAGARVNFASTRTETYAAPGALPEVALGATIEEDLRRRDFTVNAIAVALDDGREIAFPGAREDLTARRLRVLHERSFHDDPTRAYRLARYAARLGLDAEPVTAQLAREADPSTVSAERVANEIRLMLAEPDPIRCLEAATTLLGKGTVPEIDAQRARQAITASLAQADPAIVLIASGQDPSSAAAWAERLGLPRSAIDTVRRAARADEVAERLRAATRPSELAAVARREPPEALALAAALGASDEARRASDLARTPLAITGADLRAAGVPEGPQLGAALRRVRDAVLDGEVEPTRDAQLRAALGR